MSWIRRIRRNSLKAAALGFAVAAVSTGTASGMAVHDIGSASQASEIPYLSHGVGITRDISSNSGVSSKSLIEQHLANEARDAARAGFVATGIEQQQGGVTPTNLARAYVARADFAGVAQPDGYQPQLRGDEPLIVRDAPDGYQPQTRSAEVVSVASGSSIDWSEFAVGFGLGLCLAGLCTLMLFEVRSRASTAHS